MYIVEGLGKTSRLHSKYHLIVADALLSPYVLNFSCFMCHILSDYGDDEIADLVDHFKPVLKESLSVDDIEIEWSSLKSELYKW